jgi:hypothetical protein
MRQSLLFRAAVLVLGTLAAAPARADTVRLRNGNDIEGVTVRPEGDYLRVFLEKGSMLIAKEDILAVVPGPTRAQEAARARDELAKRKLAAGEDPARLREAATWARQNRLPDESDQLLALARGIELDRKLDDLRDCRDAGRFLALAHSLGSFREAKPGEPQASRGDFYSAAERSFVLDRALAIDPENAQVRLELGQVKRDGRWVTLAEAERIDNAAIVREMTARGYVAFEGKWMTPDAVAAIERDRAAAEAERERAAADEAQAAADAARAAADAQATALLEAQAQAAQPWVPYSPYTYGYVYPYYGAVVVHPDRAREREFREAKPGEPQASRSDKWRDHDRDARWNRPWEGDRRWTTQAWNAPRPTGWTPPSPPRTSLQARGAVSSSVASSSPVRASGGGFQASAAPSGHR